MERRRRCQSFTPEQRIAILKQVGRYIADPPKPDSKQRDILQKELGGYIEPLIQKQNGAETEEENAKDRTNQDQRGEIQHKGPLFVPGGKRLTTCTSCNKPGYKYKTYFQHSNEPPIGARMLRETQDGWRYRRCGITKGKVKTEQDKKKSKINPVPVHRENVKSSREIVLKKLDRFVEESSSNLSREDDTGKDYKKMYWDLIDNLRKIVDDADRPIFPLKTSNF